MESISEPPAEPDNEPNNEPAEEQTGEEEEPDEGEEGDSFLKEMFFCHGGDMYADDDPEDTYQRVYWTDGEMIVREKRGDRWVYSTENE
jgi:hypothetical protein